LSWSEAFKGSIKGRSGLKKPSSSEKFCALAMAGDLVPRLSLGAGFMVRLG